LLSFPFFGAPTSQLLPASPPAFWPQLVYWIINGRFGINNAVELAPGTHSVCILCNQPEGATTRRENSLIITVN